MTKESVTKGTLHVYFAGGFKDGVIESYDDPPIVMKFHVDDETVHVYQLQFVEDVNAKAMPVMRGRQAMYVFAGVEYVFEEETNEQTRTQEG